jgi:type IV pilus assembly protein PilM
MALLPRWLSSPPPTVGLEIRTTHVGAVLLRAGGDPSVGSFVSETLPEGAVVPSLLNDNIADRAAVAGAVARVMRQVGSPRRVALVLPDSAAKVSIVHFDKVPSRPEDLAQLVRWQVRKAVPFPLETAQVGFAEAGGAAQGGREFVVVVMRREVVQGYESLLEGTGAMPGLVDLASFNVVNMVLSGDRRKGRSVAGDWLLVHLTRQSSTLAIVRAGALVFYRNRLTDGQEPLTDLVHQTAMYYEDRLGGQGFGRVVLSATTDALAAEPSDLRQTLADRLQSPVEPIDPEQAARLEDGVLVAYDELVSMAAPLGIVLREAA